MYQIKYSYSSEYICYDDGCHLRKFCRNPIRRDLTPTTKKLASLPIMVDKMHIAGHVDAWCLENCDSRKVKELENVSWPAGTRARVVIIKSSS